MSISTLFAFSQRRTCVRNSILRCFIVSAALATGAPSHAAIEIVKTFGNPTWQLSGAVQSTVHDIGMNGSDANINVRAWLSDVLGANHDSRSNSKAFIPNTEHDGPYDNEFREALAAAGVVNTDVFLASDLVLPNLELLNYVIVPTQDASLGAPDDFSIGPVISEEVFPIRASDQFFLNGSRIGQKHTDVLDSHGLNHSHLPAYDLSGRHPGETVIGKWEGIREFRDAQGNGYEILETFTVVREPTDILGDLSFDEELDHHDLNILTQNVAVGATNLRLDMNGDTQVNVDDIYYWVIELNSTWIGDANLDGEFNSGDLVDVFQAGKYETAELARWLEGDWNGDEKFNSGDLVVAFQSGGYEMGSRPDVAAVPEPSSWILLALGLLGLRHALRS